MMNPEQRVCEAVMMLSDALKHALAYAEAYEPRDMMAARRALSDARERMSVFHPQYDAEARMEGEMSANGLREPSKVSDDEA